MAALSLGYWWGARLTDRRTEARLLGGIILLAKVRAIFLPRQLSCNLRGVEIAYSATGLVANAWSYWLKRFLK